MGLVITKIFLVGWRKRDIIGKSGNHLESVASGGLAWRIIVKGRIRASAGRHLPGASQEQNRT